MGELHDPAPTERIRKYRALAEQAQADAEHMPEGEMRADFLAIADSWRRLADDVEAAEARRASFKLRDPFCKH